MTEPTTSRAVWDEDAEQAVLAAMLIDDRAVAVARAALHARDFYATRHQLIFAAMARVIDHAPSGSAAAGAPMLDPVTLAHELIERGELEVAGGKDYIGFLVDAVPTAANVEYHAKIVCDAAKCRALTECLAEHAHDLKRGALTADDAVIRLQPVLDAFASGASVDAFRCYDDAAIMELPPATFLIGDMLPLGGVCEMHGPPGVGKSFIALDIALSVASGKPFLGRPVERAAVTYIAAEGSSGLPNRVGAWKARHGYGGMRLGVNFITEPVSLLDAANVSRFLTALRTQGEPPGLLVFDTLARCMVSGDENSAKDMGLVIANVGRIQRATGAAVLLVHHTRKDGEVERGSTALRGAMDTMLAVKGDEGTLSLVCDKQKDAPEFEPIRLRLDPEGESCVVVAAIHAWQSASQTMTPNERKALESLSSSFLADGATAGQWRAASDIPERSFYRIRTLLVTRGYVNDPHGVRGGHYTLTDAGHRAIAANCQLTAA